MSAKRSPEAKARRAAKDRERRALKRALRPKPEPPMDAGNLCRRCWKRPHVPLHELCRACRYYTRSET